MTDRQPAPIPTSIPDLSGVPLDRIAEEGGPGLARAIEQYRERVKETGLPLSSFNARI